MTENGDISPVIVATAAELLMFRNVAAAEAYLEPIDVEEGEYLAAWDAAGRPLSIATVPAKHHGWIARLASASHVVRLMPSGSDPDDVELCARIGSHLDGKGRPPENASLAAHFEALHVWSGFVY